MQTRVRCCAIGSRRFALPISTSARATAISPSPMLDTPEMPGMLQKSPDFSTAVLTVRIHLPPAGSQTNSTGSLETPSSSAVAWCRYPAATAAGDPAHASLRGHSYSIPDNLVALLTRSGAWNCSAGNCGCTGRDQQPQCRKQTAAEFVVTSRNDPALPAESISFEAFDIGRVPDESVVGAKSDAALPDESLRPPSHRPPRRLAPLLPELRYQRLGLFPACIRRRCSMIHAWAAASVANVLDGRREALRNRDLYGERPVAKRDHAIGRLGVGVGRLCHWLDLSDGNPQRRSSDHPVMIAKKKAIVTSHRTSRQAPHGWSRSPVT
jgi:hypothetical protein